MCTVQINMISGSNITGIVFFSLFFGVILGRVGERARALKEVIDGLSEVRVSILGHSCPGQAAHPLCYFY